MNSSRDLAVLLLACLPRMLPSFAHSKRAHSEVHKSSSGKVKNIPFGFICIFSKDFMWTICLSLY